MKKTFFAFIFLCSCAKGLDGSSEEETNNGGNNSTSSVVSTGSTSSNSSTTSTVSSTSSSSTTVTSSSSGMVCIPGTTQLCNGPGACAGAQACNSDGMGYGECVCSSSAANDVVSVGVTTAGVTTGGGSFTCDPLNPTIACGSGKQCLPQTNDEPICAPAGNGNFFDLCLDYSQCLPGLDCVNDGMNSCCMAWCRLGNNDCPNGFTCVEVLGNPSINGVIYGVCWDGFPCVL